jgi:hypothetical protein
MEHIARDDRVCVIGELAEVADFERHRVGPDRLGGCPRPDLRRNITPQLDGNLRIGVELDRRTFGNVESRVLQTCPCREMPDGNMAADALGVTEPEFPPNSFRPLIE